MLDQPTGVDPLHPHLLVKAATDFDVTMAELQTMLITFGALHRQGELTPKQADLIAHEISARVVQLRNRATAREEPREKPLRPWGDGA